MLALPPSVKIYLATDRVDMRKSFNGLAGIAREHLLAQPMSGHLFVFLGKRSDKMKILWWDRDGWALFYKRLERGSFQLPSVSQGVSKVEIEPADLSLILEGIDAQKVRRQKRWRPPAQENR